MKVFILVARPTSDVSGEMIDPGGIIGVFDCPSKANAAWEEMEETWSRKRYDCEIEEFEVA